MADIMILRSLLVLSLALIAGSTSAQETSLVPAEPGKFHLFLLAGQSNMAGRGVVTDSDREQIPRILMFDKQGEWRPAVDPLHFDKPKLVGVGLGKTFATLYAKAHPGVTVGLIPCAVGGSPIDAWAPGGFHKSTKTHPYDDCLARMKGALPKGTLKGILWHQGESDSKPELSQAYESKLHRLIARFRNEFSAPNVPFIVGQMGQFEERPWDEDRTRVDQAHRQLPEKVSHTAFVPSNGLQHKGDNTHFDSPSYRELGKRYFDAFERLAK